MFEYQQALNKIEQWAERLPYRSLRIEVEMAGGQTRTLEKSKRPPIGFSAVEERGKEGDR